MTNLEAAALISKLYAEHARREFSAVNEYAEAVALAIMALETEDCRKSTAVKSNYCPNCGAKMDLEEIKNV